MSTGGRAPEAWALTIIAGLLTVVLAALPFAILWFAAPLLRRRKLEEES